MVKQTGLPWGPAAALGQQGSLQVGVNQGDVPAQGQAGLDAAAWLKAIFKGTQQSCHLNRN